MENGFLLKNIDIIEMEKNIIQIRLFGEIFLFEMENDQYKDNFFKLLSLFNGKLSLNEIKIKSSFSEDEIVKIIKDLEMIGLLIKTKIVKENKIPDDYIEKFMDVFKIFDLSRFIERYDSITKVYNSSVTIIGLNDLSKEVLKKLLDHGFRNINIINILQKKEININKFINDLNKYYNVCLKENKINSINDIDSSILNEYIIVPVIDYNYNDLFLKINKLAFEYNKIWIPLNILDHICYIGPTVVPKKTACYNCLELRKISNIENLTAYSGYMNYINTCNKSYPKIESHFQLLAIHFIQEFLKIITGYKFSKTYNGIVNINIYENEIKVNKVLKFPKCQICSSNSKINKYDNYAYHMMLQKLDEE